MATTMHTSATIRRSIGLAAARLQRALDSAKNYPIDTIEDDIADTHGELLALHTAILKPLTKLQTLHQQWLLLMDNDSNEKNVFTDFIDRKGDYTVLIREAVTKLEQMDTSIHNVETTADSLNITLLHPRSPPGSPAEEDDMRSNMINSTQSEFINSPISTKVLPKKDFSQGLRMPQGLQFPTAQGLQATFDGGHTMVTAPTPLVNPHAIAPELYNMNTTLTPSTALDAALLTRLDVPTFAGSIVEFPEFWTRFSALVDSKASLDLGSKFSLLKSCLKGPALECLAGIPVTAANYQLALAILQSTYNDQSTIRHILYSSILNLPNADERTLPQHYAQMNSLVRQFVSLDPTGSPEYGLAAAIFNKLPRKIRGRILDKVPTNTNITPIQLMDILGGIVRREFVIDSMVPTTNYHNVYYNSGKDSIKKKQHKDNNQKHNFRRICQFCGDDHNPKQCIQHTTYDQRIQVLKQKHLCYNCLSSEHGSKNCKSTKNCQNCDRRHHTALCKQLLQPPTPHPGHSPSPKSPNQSHHPESYRPPSLQSVPRRPHQQKHQTHFATEPSNEIAPIEHIISTEHSLIATTKTEKPMELSMELPHKQVALMCTPVTLRNPEKPELKIHTTAFFDSGSTRSYISRDIAQALQLVTLQEEDVVINVFGNQRSTFNSQLHKIGLVLQDKELYHMEVRSLPQIAHDIPCAIVEKASPSLDEKWVNMERINPGILIGNDYFWELVISDQFYSKQLKNGLHLLNTRVGIIAAGPSLTMESVYYSANEDPQSPLNKQTIDSLVEKFWTIETTGTMDTPSTEEDKKCLAHFQRHIRFDQLEERFYVKWAFRIPTIELPSNWKLAYSRLWHTWKALNKNQVNLEKYQDILSDQLQKNIIEVVTEPLTQPGLTHYLPHHAVITENKKTTKVRMVFDASAKEKGKLSLNETLYKGPDLLPDIIGILLRIRLTPILLSADIEKAFLMVGLEEPDRDFTRFLWLKDPTKPPSENNLVVYRFRRVPFGIVSSPFMLSATIHFHLANQGTELSKKILTNLYVDNTFITAETPEEAKEIYAQSKDLFSRGGMNLREWISSDNATTEFLSAQEGTTPDTCYKILGIKWLPAKDVIKVALQQSKEQKTWTKRQVLKFVASSFDPLGLLSPVILTYKLFLQSISTETMSWDDLLSDSKMKEWNQLLMSNTTTTPEIEIPRLLVKISPDKEISLHVFADASKDGYAACAYLHVKSYSSSTVHLLMAKTRISPLKKALTIPRLELSAMVLAASLVDYLKKELDVTLHSTHIWSDSKVALSWCCSSKHLPVFITNRVNHIRSKIPSTLLHHVRSEDNPADLASRGCDLLTLKNHTLWWNGPQFLQYPEDNWPLEELEPNEEEITKTATELLRNSPILPQPIYTSVVEDKSQTSLIDPNRFSCWNKMVNTLIFVMLFINKQIGKKHRQFPTNQWSVTIQLFRMAQKEKPPTPARIKQLNLQEVNGLWQMNTRVDSFPLIYLPPDSQFTALYILHHHCILLHSGVNCVLNQLRRTVWIPKGRITVKHVLKNICYACRKKKAKPFTLPPFPNLPETRTTRPLYPFYHCGMDYLGPFNTSENTKVNICLFTCLSTRLIHTEIAIDMSSTTFVNILRRFIANHGAPKTLISDNALHFKTVAAVYLTLPLRDVKDFPELNSLCIHHNMEFKFIPALSPWAGGFYERMVGIFKKALAHSLGRLLPNIETLRTISAEATAVVNCRPLTYVPNDADDQYPTAIRPIDFIRPFVNTCAPLLELEEQEWRPKETTQTELLDSWCNSTKRLDHFWNRWQTEYLDSLRERFQWKHVQGHYLSHRAPQLGELVLIHQQHIPRGLWKIGRIIELLGDTIRSVRLQLPNGNEITRPLSLLYPLEISAPLPKPHELDTGQFKKVKETTNHHPMITRNKKKNLSTTLLFAAILTLCANTTLAFKCPSTAMDKQILFAESCYSSSTTLVKYQTHNGVRLCWDYLNCTVGHVRFTPLQSRTPNSGLCGERCHCLPTVNCVPYSGPRKEESKGELLPERLHGYKPPFVCSFTPSIHCANETSMTTLSFISLHDNSTFIVEEIHTNQPQFDPKDPPICWNKNGFEVIFNTSIAVIGTKGFCSAYKCSSNPNTSYICMLRTPSAVFVSKNFSIPIASWGYILRNYYPFPKLENNTKNSSPFVSCTKGGIHIFNTAGSFVEACISSTCVHHSKYEDGLPLLFPNSLVLYDYKVLVKTWEEGKMTSSLTQECQGHPICEIITCTFCYDHLWNHTCWTIKDFLLIVAVWILSGTIYMFFSPFFFIIRILRAIVYPIRWLGSLLCSQCRKRRPTIHITSLPQYQKKTRQKLITTTMIVLLLQVCMAKACSDPITVTGSSINCLQSGDKEICSMDSTTTISLEPLAQEICLVLRDQEDHPTATVTLRVNSIVQQCNKRILFYTRDHKFYTESSHRCYSAGSCQSGRCENTKVQDKLKEFTNAANEAPGYTYCAASCGCATCNGCFLCNPSCLFYRYYAQSTTNTVYTIFDCPTWQTTLSGTAILEKEGASSQTVNFKLNPARSFRWNDLLFTMASYSSPPLPIFGSNFLDNGKTISLLPPAISNFGLNSPGQLKCSSKEAAEKFSCSFSEEVCKCVTAASSATCSCINGDMSKYASQAKLPLSTQNVILHPKDNNIEASSSLGTAVQLLITTYNMTWTKRITKNQCNIIIHKQLDGCYSCLGGAQLEASCKSTPTEEVAEIQCGKKNTVMLCTPKEEKQIIRIHFEESQINQECILRCRFDQKKFTIQGQLSFVAEYIPLEPNETPNNWREHYEGISETLAKVWSWITDQTLKLVLIVIIVIVALLRLKPYFVNSLVPPPVSRKKR